jgi:uncharacterized protein (DUF427 family)
MKWPNHTISEQRVSGRMQVAIGGEIIADSSDVVKVEEDNHPARLYFPRADVKAEALERTPTTSECPFKGTANYFAINARGKRLDDAAWSYEDPYDEHAQLKDRVAFYTEKVPEVEIRTAR